MLANVMLDLDALPAGAAPVLIDAFLKGFLLLVVCSVAVLALRRASAALRHLIWTIGLSGVLIMPVLNAVLPDWRVLMPMPVIARSAPVKDGFDAVIQPASTADSRALTTSVGAAQQSEASPQKAATTLDGVAFKVSTEPQTRIDWRLAAFSSGSAESRRRWQPAVQRCACAGCNAARGRSRAVHAWKR
jgi:hypothetical protein